MFLKLIEKYKNSILKIIQNKKLEISEEEIIELKKNRLVRIHSLILDYLLYYTYKDSKYSDILLLENLSDFINNVECYINSLTSESSSYKFYSGISFIFYTAENRKDKVEMKKFIIGIEKWFMKNNYQIEIDDSVTLHKLLEYLYVKSKIDIKNLERESKFMQEREMFHKKEINILTSSREDMFSFKNKPTMEVNILAHRLMMNNRHNGGVEDYYTAISSSEDSEGKVKLIRAQEDVDEDVSNFKGNRNR